MNTFNAFDNQSLLFVKAGCKKEEVICSVFPADKINSNGFNLQQRKFSSDSKKKKKKSNYKYS